MRNRVFLAIAAMVFSPLAISHDGGGAMGGVVQGFWHPLSGSDHLLAMFAIGLLAASFGGTTLFAMPLIFIVGIVSGALLAFSTFPIGIVEYGTIAAVIIVGLQLAYYRDAHRPTAYGVVLALCVFQGFGHVGEANLSNFHLDYGLGFLLSGLLAQLAGVATGFLAQWTAPTLLRGAGVAVAMSGAYAGLSLLA